MKTQVSLRKENNEIVVVVPFNQEFIKSAKNLQGKWNHEKGAWIFDDSLEEYVKYLLVRIYGVTGETTYKTCTLIVKNYSAEIMNNAVVLFGRTIAKASGRDTGARLGDDIIWLSGNYTSGGSAKYWKTIVENGNFEIQNFPVARTEFKDVQQAIKEGWVEIKVTETKRSKEEIEKEIADLKEKLAKLEEELNNL